jgi:hypothetical protein
LLLVKNLLTYSISLGKIVKKSDILQMVALESIGNNLQKLFHEKYSRVIS